LSSFGSALPDLQHLGTPLCDLILVGSKQPWAVDLKACNAGLTNRREGRLRAHGSVSDSQSCLAVKIVFNLKTRRSFPDGDANSQRSVIPILEFAAQRASLSAVTRRLCQRFDENLSPGRRRSWDGICRKTNFRRRLQGVRRFSTVPQGLPAERCFRSLLGGGARSSPSDLALRASGRSAEAAAPVTGGRSVGQVRDQLMVNSKKKPSPSAFTPTSSARLLVQAIRLLPSAGRGTENRAGTPRETDARINPVINFVWPSWRGTKRRLGVLRVGQKRLAPGRKQRRSAPVRPGPRRSSRVLTRMIETC